MTRTRSSKNRKMVFSASKRTRSQAVFLGKNTSHTASKISSSRNDPEYIPTDEDSSSSNEFQDSAQTTSRMESTSNAASTSKAEMQSLHEDSTDTSSDDSENTPRCGQTFNSEEDFVKTVKEYARHQGFTVRLSKVVKTKSGSLRKRDLVCSHARTTALNRRPKGNRNKALMSTACPFRVRASYDVHTAKWHVLIVTLKHNHPMVAKEQKRYMSSERSLPDEVKKEVLDLHRAGIPTSLICNALKVKFGDSAAWLYNDIYNFLYQHSASQKEVDAQAFIETLNQLQSSYHGLAFKYQLHPSTNQLQRVIWMFPEQKTAYSRFSDVLVFDNTYATNRFRMPLGVFTGVNSHGQSVCFAGSLIDSETTEAFVWLFSSFLEMVSGNSPGVVLTDDDKAIGSAIDQTFAVHNTTHRLCHWHMLRNVMKNLLHVLGSSWATFLRGFHDCLNETDKDEFHMKWETLKREYPAAGNYLLKMERKVTRWAPCYSCDVFMADMSTSQRGESMNNLLKYYLDATTSLNTFLEAFSSALEVRTDAENYARYREEHFSLRLATKSPLEEQAYALLTWYAFRKFQEQLVEAASYGCSETSRSSDDNMVVYSVGRLSSSTVKFQTVVYENSTQDLRCSCKRMKLTGIPCRHILRAAIQLNLEQLPEHFFLTRWCKDPPLEQQSEQYRSFYSPQESQDHPEVNYTPMQHEEFHMFMLNKTARKMERFAKQNPGSAKLLHDEMNKILDGAAEKTPDTAESSSLQIRNPLVVSTKGSKKNTTLKKGAKHGEKTGTTVRKITCGTCGNQGHTSRSKLCPGRPVSDSEETVTGERININTKELFTDLEDLEVDQEEQSSCPFCLDVLPNPWPPKILERYNKLTDNGKRSLIAVDRYEFCKFHRAELETIPAGVEKGYPTEIDFDSLPQRVRNLERKLKTIIKGKVSSYYRQYAEDAYAVSGKKAAQPTALYGRFEILQPGYYGPHGAMIMMNTLKDMFLKTKFVTNAITYPQSPLEYLHEVLVPETTIMLIQEDFSEISFEEAKKIMEDSSSFGSHLFPLDDSL